MCPPKVLQVHNRLGLNASSFHAKFAGTFTAGQCMCYGEDFTHWFSNFHSCYMKRDESCLVANSPSEPKFSDFIRCRKMVEIHGYNEHVSVTQSQLLVYPNQLCYRRSHSEGILCNLHASQLPRRLFTEPTSV